LRYRAAKAGKLDDAAFYEIATTYYKQETYTNLAHERRDEPEEQPPGFCDFPYDRPDRYFDGLTAEEKRKDGFHAGGRRNEPLDCRVMALCARDIFLDARVAELKAAALKAGASKEELKKISTRDVINLLVRKTARRRAA